MEIPRPYIDILSPDGTTTTILIGDGGLRIGRTAALVDVLLGPDPQRLISKLHCLIERRDDAWHLMDNGSTNGTFLRHAGKTERIDGMAPLKDGDAIFLLGTLLEDHAPRFWEITFHDPAAVTSDATNYAAWGLQPQDTTPVPPSRDVCLIYDWTQARLYRVSAGSHEEISGLRLQEQQLIRYMAERNRRNGNIPVLCSYEEMIEAVWGEDTHHTQADITHLVWELRKKLDTGTYTSLIETVRKSGCRLQTCANPR